MNTINNYIDLLNIVHPKYIDLLLSGHINSKSIIETKCPICNNYAEHTMHSIYNFSKDKLKYNTPPVCSNCYMSRISKTEIEIAEYISTFYSGECIRNSRNIITPYELDLYYPNKYIAVEYNGSYWHSDKFKEKDYHINKFLKCKENHILLVSIFEFNWNANKNEIKEYLKDLFNDKENNLSFNEDHSLMNNNYPSNNYINNSYSIEESYSIVDNNRIYMCGYSVILDNTSNIIKYETFDTHKNKRLSLDELKEKYIGQTFNWLTILDVFKDEKSKRYTFKCICKCGNITNKQYNKVVSGHTKSCGCYKFSEEYSNTLCNYWNNNSDKVKEKTEKYKQWCKNNTDKLIERGKKHSQFYKDNPDILELQKENRSKTFCK